MASELKVGSVVALLADVDAFKEAFARVDSDGDEMCGWTFEKQQHRGNRGTVVEIYDDRTLSLIFSNGEQFEFPFEAIGISYGQEQIDIDWDDLSAAVPVTVHEHALVSMCHHPKYEERVKLYGRDNAACDGRALEGGCRSNMEDPYFRQNPRSAFGFYKDADLYTCHECGFDLCKLCAKSWAGSIGTNISVNRQMSYCVVHKHGLREAFTKFPWRCAGIGLPGGCKGGLSDKVASRGQTSCYICEVCPKFALCRDCHESFVRRDIMYDEMGEADMKLVLNDEQAECSPSFDDAHDFCAKFYCGRQTTRNATGAPGEVSYHNKYCRECDGVCGPASGCQCESCYRLDAIPRVSKHILRKALKISSKEWRRSKIMIVGEGRAGKTALANSIIGKEYKSTESTIGINQLTVNVNYASLGDKSWSECKRPDNEFESAIAENVLKEKRRSAMRHARKNKARPVSELATKTTTASTCKNKMIKTEEWENEKNIVITELEIQSASLNPPLRGPKDIDEDLVLSCLADNVDLGTLLISIFDYGGQSVFNVIHHFFLTQYGVYCLVFNMEWLVDAAADTLDVSSHASDRKRCIEYMRFWLNSVIVHTRDDVSGATARIAFVGTRKDKVSSPAAHEKIHTLLHMTFSESMAWPYIIENLNAEGPNGKMTSCFFAVDNTKSRHDPTMGLLMNTIEASMNEEEYTHTAVPLPWFRALDRVSKEEGRSYIRLDEFSLMAEACGVKLGEVSLLLSFLHNMGHLMWLNEPGLREMVILDPVSFFVAPATVIICKHNPDVSDGICHVNEVHKRASKQHNRKWLALTKKGILSTDLLPTLWSDYRAHSPVLLSLMVKFGLLVPLQSDDVAEESANEGSKNNDAKSSSLSCRSFLVPSLLPLPDPAVLQWFNECVVSTCFFVFTSLPDLAESTTITESDLVENGFLPGGLFERVVGKALSWSLSTSPSKSHANMVETLFKDLIVLNFGNQMFRMQALADVHCIRLDVVGKSPRAVFNRVREIIERSMAECMKALLCIPCLPYDETSGHAQAVGTTPSDFKLRASETNTTSTSSSSSTSSPSSVLLIPLDRISDAVDKHSVLTRKGGRALLDAGRAKVQFEAWLPNRDLLEAYDIFISYRWGVDDSELAQAVYMMMQNFSVGVDNRAVDVFLDDVRLKSGRSLQGDFIRAMRGTSIVAPLITYDALQRMITHDPEVVDNVLMEWIFALECVGSPTTTRVRSIFPVFVGQRDKLTGQCASLFGSAVLLKLSEKVPAATLSALARAMLALGVTPSASFADYTVKSIVGRMLEFKGFILSSNPQQQIEKVVHMMQGLLSDSLSTSSASSILLSSTTAATTADIAQSRSPLSRRQLVTATSLQKHDAALQSPSSSNASSPAKEKVLAEMVNDIRAYFGLASELRTKDVIDHAGQVLNISSELTEIKSMKDKAVIVGDVMTLIERVRQAFDLPASLDCAAVVAHGTQELGLEAECAALDCRKALQLLVDSSS